MKFFSMESMQSGKDENDKTIVIVLPAVGLHLSYLMQIRKMHACKPEKFFKGSHVAFSWQLS